jgi:hypothetical protein
MSEIQNTVNIFFPNLTTAASSNPFAPDFLRSTHKNKTTKLNCDDDQSSKAAGRKIHKRVPQPSYRNDLTINTMEGAIRGIEVGVCDYRYHRVRDRKGEIFLSLKEGLGQTQAWMPTYVSIIRFPQMI